MGGALVVLGLLAGPTQALDLRNALSPRNAERPLRRATQYIILHTTEGPEKGSLQKLRDNGEAHYFLAANGTVYRVVDRRKVALHCGRSMWNGRTGIDEVSLGVEISGFHNRDLTTAQYRALRELLAELQSVYKIPDERVLTHSMVAYGTPNRWVRYNHRGRKRCGMLFAKKSVRRRLGLSAEPAYDPDVKAGRLRNADPYLASVLYQGAGEKPAPALAAGPPDVIQKGQTAWDLARDEYNSVDTQYILPDGRRLRGNEITDWNGIPVGTRVIAQCRGGDSAAEVLREIGRDGASADELAGSEALSATTVYFLPDGRIQAGDVLGTNGVVALPVGTRVLVGYAAAGEVQAGRAAFDLCGARWNHASTYYRLPDGSLVAGDRVREKAIPPGTRVFVVK